MPSSVQAYAQMADHAATQITSSHKSWTDFLTTAARLFKYPYHEQLMIYAQRPDATACADYELWNEKMRRYVRRGSKGIALIDTTGDKPRLRYVFDVSDTDGGENSRRSFLWQYRPEHTDAVTAMLERSYDVSGESGFADQLEQIATQMAGVYWQEHQYDILHIVDNSFLEEYDDFNIGVQFRHAATVSITYALMSRCGFSPKDYFSHEDFLSIFDFNNPATVAALGTAVSEINQHVLRQIEITIKNYEREHLAERSVTHGEHHDLQQEWGLPYSGSDDYRVGGAYRQIREDAEELPEGASPNIIEQPAAVREAVPAPDGDRPDGAEPDGVDDTGADGGERSYGDIESQRSDEVGWLDEQPESPSGGSYSERAGLQLSLFPSEEEQIQIIDEAERVANTPFAFSFKQDEIDHVLRLGSNTDHSRLHVCAKFKKGTALDEIAGFLKAEYRGGSGFLTTHGNMSAWYAEDGIHLSQGSAVRHVKNVQIITWRDAAERIGQLLEQGNFTTNVELAEVDGYERTQLADTLWYLRGDMADESRQVFLDAEVFRGGFPDSTARLANLMAEPESLAKITNELTAFVAAYENDRSLLRFNFHKPRVLLDGITDLQLPRRKYATDMAELPEIGKFITDDEINAVLSYGSSVEGGKGRIYAYFSETHTTKEQVDFLKNEYGTGGRSHAVSGSSRSYEDHSAKGVKLTKGDCAAVELSWSNVAKRIMELINKDRYLTPEEKARFEEIQGDKAGMKPVQELSEQPDADEPGLTEDELIDLEAERAIDDREGEFGADGYRSFPGNAPDMEDGMTATIVTPHAITQDDIDRALQDWNGDTGSKHRVAEYMAEYARDKNAAAFLRAEYGDDLPAFSVTTDGAALDLPWTKVQRRIGQLMEAGQLTVEAGRSVTEPALVSTLREQPVIQPAPENFRITDDRLGEGGAKAKYIMNAAAINLLKELEFDRQQATPEEQEVLSRYVGWGGLPQVFDVDNAAWTKEFTELYAILSSEEYASARASTLNAHYTSPTVIRAIYEAVGNMGFTTGNILEPALGVGNFFGLLPEEMSASKLYGVELDSITGRIAKQLYPNADITVSGFETTDRRDFYDLAVGNVPFGQYKVADKAYDKLGFSIHDYFFAKSIDQVRPGGVVAFVTSRYTMDKQSPEVRRYIAERAELLGAIRLPNTAFKANAGTEVVSDILFLQKRDRPIVIDEAWIHLGKSPEGYDINSYFVEHPDMILGTLKTESTQYGREECTVVPNPGADLAAQLSAAVKNIGGQITEAELPDLGDGEKIDASIPADPNVKNFSYTIVDGEVYFRENSRMVRPELNITAKDRVRGMVELRDCVQKLIGQQLDGFVSDTAIRETQAELNALYDKYIDKYGLINSRGNALAFADDSSYYLLCSLEVLDEEGNLDRKADMFTKRTIKQNTVVTSVDTASEALALSIAEKACVDMEYMTALTGRDEETLAKELFGVIFKDFIGMPDGKYSYRTADEFLSGNVREKLRKYEKGLEYTSEHHPNYPFIRANVEVLKTAQPKDLDASEIEVRLGATWIGKDYIQAFMYELLDPPYYLRRNIEVNFSVFTAEWNITGKSSLSYNNINAYVTYGTDRANAYRILEDSLNLRDVRIYDTVQDADGKERRVLNSKETTLAQQKQQAIKDAFRDWIWKDPERRQTLIQEYNEIFNSCRPREYDGQHITFSGMNPEISLREHQLNAVAHILYGGNTLLAHEVGAGKSATRS